jgi:hypothetical protein
MKKQLLLLSVFCSAFVSFSQADTLLFEDFESFPTFPIGWSTSTNANTYTGFYVGDTAAANAGNYWDVLDNGSSQFVMTNDDVSDDSLDAERLILPVQDFSLDSNLCLSFDVYLDKARGSSRCYIETSIDNGLTWVRIDSVERDWTQWQYRAVDLRSLNYQSNVLISFFWSDGSIIGSPKHSTGVAIDNIAIRHIPTNDLVLHEVYLSGDFTHYGTKDIQLAQAKLIISNYSLDSCVGGKIIYSVGDVSSNVIDSILISPLASFARDTFEIPMLDFNSGFSGFHIIAFELNNLNVDYNEFDNSDLIEYHHSEHQKTGRIYDSLTVSRNSYNISYGDTVEKVAFLIEDEVAVSLINSGVCFLGVRAPVGGAVNNVIEVELYEVDNLGNWIFIELTEDYIYSNPIEGDMVELSLQTAYPGMLSGTAFGLAITNFGSPETYVSLGKRAKNGTVYYVDHTNTWFKNENAYYPEMTLGFYDACWSNIEENQINISLAPNPSSGGFNYELESSIIGQLQVLDLNGRVVFEQNISSSMGSIDLSHLDNAVYLLQLIDSGAVVATEKLVLQK